MWNYELVETTDMNSIWSRLYDGVKDRRYGLLFLFSAGAFVGFLALAALVEAGLEAVYLEEYFLQALLVLAGAALGWGVAGFWRERLRREERQRFPPLSSDEKRVARSKLVKRQ
jgi:threonine/homoserine/homoserine lactone efflux protein